MTEPKKRGRPPKPEGPKVALNLRVPKELKQAAHEAAEERHESLSHAVEALLRRYVAQHRRKKRGA